MEIAYIFTTCQPFLNELDFKDKLITAIWKEKEHLVIYITTLDYLAVTVQIKLTTSLPQRPISSTYIKIGMQLMAIIVEIIIVHYSIVNKILKQFQCKSNVLKKYFMIWWSWPLSNVSFQLCFLSLHDNATSRWNADEEKEEAAKQTENRQMTEGQYIIFMPITIWRYFHMYNAVPFPLTKPICN